MDNAGVFLFSKESLMALLTGFFTFLALFLFIRGFLKGKNKPYVWAWVVRVAICIVAFFGQFSQGATYSLALAFSQILCGLCIIGLIIYTKPAMGKLDKVDWMALIIATMGVVLWITSGNSLYSILGVIVADSCATAIGIRASVINGSRESIPFWVCALAAASMALLSAKDATWAIMLAPLFSCLNAIANIFAATYVKQSRSAINYQSDTKLFPTLANQED